MYLQTVFRDRRARGVAALVAASCVFVATVSTAVSAPGGPLLIEDSFESGDLSNWSVQACDNDSALAYSATSQPNWPSPLEGTHAARFVVDESDVAPCTPTDNPRAQIVSDGLLEEGAEVWETWAIYFPETFPEMTSWYVFQQDYGSPFNGSPSIGFGVTGNDMTISREERYGYDEVWSMPLQRGQWYRYLVHKKMAKDESGFMQLWVDGQQQTFSNGRTTLNTATMHADADGPYSFYLNSYRDTGIADTVETFYDDVRVGTTRQSVTDVDATVSPPLPSADTASASPDGRPLVAPWHHGYMPGSLSSTVRSPSSTPASRNPAPRAASAATDIENMVWNGDFETGDISQYFHYTDWGGLLGGDVERLTVVDDPLGSSSKVGKFTINPGGTRNEILTKAPDMRNGDSYVFGFSTLLEDGFPIEADNWQVITQWKNDGEGSPPLSLDVGGGEFSLAGGYHVGATFSEPLGPAATGEWVDWVFAIEFVEGGGSVDVWMNNEPVLTNFRPDGGTLYPGLGSYLKTGYYRDSAIGTKGTIYYDNWRVASR